MRQKFFFFLKFFGGHKSFSWGHWYPCFGLQVMSALGFKAKVGPFCMFSRLCDPQIHLWCDTSWLYRGQYGSRAFLIHIPADVSASIGGGSGLEQKFFNNRQQGTLFFTLNCWNVQRRFSSTFWASHTSKQSFFLWVMAPQFSQAPFLNLVAAVPCK